MSDELKAYDKIGQEITDGCYIAYGSLSGRSACLKIGKVQKLTIDVGEHRYSPGTIHLTYRIRVQGLPMWSSKDDLGKPGTLQYPERCIVLNPNTIDPSIMKTLQKIK